MLTRNVVVTTEDDFQRAIDADLTDWQTRLVFADWLEDRGDPRAPGYRALGTRRMLVSHGTNAKRQEVAARGSTQLWWWTTIAGRRDSVPTDWFALIEGLEPKDELFKPRATGHNCNTRRDAEDAAALAFGKLPAARQAELLAERPNGR